jgi:hypothetical protein
VGGATDEGWAQFIASAAYNNPEDVSGTFVYHKKMMKWSGSHDGALTWPIDLWWGHPSYHKVYWVPPTTIALDSGGATTDFARWVEEECDPTGDDFEHYGTEWDWLNFFWNLWVDGDDGFSVSEIANVWDMVPDVAYFCCNSITTPTTCEEKYPGTACGTIPYNPLPFRIKVGKLWEDDGAFYVNDSVRETAAIWYNDPVGHPLTYDPDKYWLFSDTGENTRVNY